MADDLDCGAETAVPEGYTVLAPGQVLTVGQKVVVDVEGSVRAMVVTQVFGDGRYELARALEATPSRVDDPVEQLHTAAAAGRNVISLAGAAAGRVDALLPDLHQVTVAAQELRTLLSDAGMGDDPDMLPLLLACGEAEVAALHLIERVRATITEAHGVVGALHRAEAHLHHRADVQATMERIRQAAQ